jgi:hypothetical protein
VKRNVPAVEREVGLAALEPGIDRVLAVGEAAHDDRATDEGRDPPPVLGNQRPIANADAVTRHDAAGRQHRLVAVEVVVVALDSQNQILAVAHGPAEVVAERDWCDIADELAARVMAQGHAAAGARLRQEDHPIAVERPVGVDAGLGELDVASLEIDDGLRRPRRLAGKTRRGKPLRVGHDRRVGERPAVRRDPCVCEHPLLGLEGEQPLVAHLRRRRGRGEHADGDQR